MGKRILTWIAYLVLQVTLISVPAAAGTNDYLLQSPTPAQAQAVCARYGFQMVRSVNNSDLYLVRLSDAVLPSMAKQWVKGDPDVKNLELDDDAEVPEADLPNTSALPTASVATANSNNNATTLFGAKVWVGYAQQPALNLINASVVQRDQITGAGIVAIIDTGVDPRHPALSSVLVPGYDFTRNLPGSASELADLNQSTAAILEQSTSTILMQSTAAILEGSRVVQLNQSTAAILEQSTAAVLEGQLLPRFFGHGTMVVGLVHLVAPTAKIMPLKAFKADGTSKISDIVRAIYYAADNGAKVINMSFSLPQFSDEVMRAVNYASRKGVICVASVGNENQNGLVYPAALGNSVGVGSTTMNDQRAPFSNYGADLVAVAAPGEGLVTTYPGGHYAAVWGTSFSSALAAGGASLLADAFNSSSGSNSNTSTGLQGADARRAFSNAVSCCSGELGAGRLNLDAAVQYIRRLRLPATTTPVP